MAEPETQTEDETVTSEFLGEVKTETDTDTDVTKDATIESGDEIFPKSTDYESEAYEDSKETSGVDEESVREMKTP